MHVLIIHQYFLEKNDGGGSRWNEMSRLWAEQGHEVTVIAGTTHYTSGEKNIRYKSKYIFDDAYAKNLRVLRCHVSETYNKNFAGRLWGYFSFVLSGIYAGLFKAREKYDLIIVSSPPLFVGIIAYVLSVFKKISYIFEVQIICL
jgi:hypothetical protein